jgi:alanyl-tRNA synthetase
MPTQRLYYDDAFEREFTADVLSCEPVVAETIDPPAIPSWRVTLDRTAFYPTSGGQPHDIGQLGTADVLDVHDEVEYVTHIIDRPIDLRAVSGRINWDRRFDHMQQHSGQHLLSAVFQRHFSLPTVSFHLGSAICTIDLRGREPTQEVLEGVAIAANQIVYEDRAVNVIYGTAEQLAKSGVRKEVHRSGILRAIEIESLDLQPCGGTHVRRTGQIGMILVPDISKIRQDWRVEFACGRRAERLARRDFATLKAVAQRLNCSTQETISAAERVVAERDSNFKSARASLQKLAEAQALSALQTTEIGADGIRVVARVFQGVPPEYVQFFAVELAKFEYTIALAVRSECGHCFFAQHPTAGKDMNTILLDGLKEVGGKGGGTRDSARGRLTDPKDAPDLLESALSQLGRDKKLAS